MFKFLVLNPSSKADEIVKKANIQNQKNHFELVLLLNRLESPTIRCDSPTYFPGAQSENSEHLTGINGVLKLSCGVTIAFVEESTLDYNGKIDIMMLKQWPSLVSNLIKKNSVATDFSLDKLIAKFTPRYIFGPGEFHEYGPFEWDNGVISRFISLSPEGEGKWFYAFNFPLVATEVAKTDLVENPFSSKQESIGSIKRVHEEKIVEKPVKKARVVTPQECFFCLSNPNVETHMIINIGQLVYMTVAKGPLTRSNASMPFSGHGIMIPVEHIAKNTESVDTEINDIEKKLYQRFKEKYPELVLVVFDINLDKNVHYHRQFMPINRKYLEGDTFEKVLQDKGDINNEKYQKNHKLKFEKVSKVLLDQQYISFKVYFDENPDIYQSLIQEDKIVDLQFPRRVLSYIIKSPKRLYWDKCQQPKFKESQDCEEFKTFFN